MSESGLGGWTGRLLRVDLTRQAIAVEDLNEHWARQCVGGLGVVELDEGATLADLIERLEIPDPLAQMVLIDGLQEPRSREERASRALEDGQTVSIFPPVAGG